MTEKENTQFVTITLEEYKTLLLKEQPKDNLKVVLNALYQLLCDHVKYAEKSTYYGANYIGDNMKFYNSDFDNSNLESDFVTFFRALKYVDTNAYMELWNKIQTEQRKKEEAKAKADQMNKAKEIRKEAEEGC